MSKADILRIPDYLGHILEAIERIDTYLTDIDRNARQTSPFRAGKDSADAAGVHCGG